MDTISFKNFQKLDLRVATIKSAEKIEGADKLLKLTLDLTDGPSTGALGKERTIAAGIAKTHDPESLLGKQIVIVANLEPKEMRGVLSQGMLLAASNENDEAILIVPEKETVSGAEVR